MTEWTPIDHRPPLPRIETRPKRTEPPRLVPEHVQQQIDQINEMMRLKEGERVWGHVVDVAKGG